MPICPECRRTWPDGVVLCRDCRVALEDTLDDTPDPAHDELGEESGDESGRSRERLRLVPLRDVPDPVIAALWQGALESQGLHPVVHSRALPGYGQILQDWNSRAWGELMVPEEELTEARAVLADFLSAAENSPLGEDEEP